ncbi:hypothetical protein C7M84_020815, partial [Penaeus vannamei]
SFPFLSLPLPPFFPTVFVPPPPSTFNNTFSPLSQFLLSLSPHFLPLTTPLSHYTHFSPLWQFSSSPLATFSLFSIFPHLSTLFNFASSSLTSLALSPSFNSPPLLLSTFSALPTPLASPLFPSSNSFLFLLFLFLPLSFSFFHFSSQSAPSSPVALIHFLPLPTHFLSHSFCLTIPSLISRSRTLFSLSFPQLASSSPSLPFLPISNSFPLNRFSPLFSLPTFVLPLPRSPHCLPLHNASSSPPYHTNFLSLPLVNSSSSSLTHFALFLPAFHSFFGIFLPTPASSPLSALPPSSNSFLSRHLRAFSPLFNLLTSPLLPPIITLLSTPSPPPTLTLSHELVHIHSSQLLPRPRLSSHLSTHLPLHAFIHFPSLFQLPSSPSFSSLFCPLSHSSLSASSQLSPLPTLPPLPLPLSALPIFPHLSLHTFCLLFNSLSLPIAIFLRTFQSPHLSSARATTCLPLPTIPSSPLLPLYNSLALSAFATFSALPNSRPFPLPLTPLSSLPSISFPAAPLCLTLSKALSTRTTPLSLSGTFLRLFHTPSLCPLCTTFIFLSTRVPLSHHFALPSLCTPSLLSSLYPLSRLYQLLP